MSNRATPLVTKLLAIAALAVIFSAFLPSVQAQEKVQDKDRDRALTMLRRIKDQLKKNYYDPKYHGMDIEARFKTAEDKIKADTSVGQIFGTIAQVLIELEDSHTVFLPPSRAYTTDYGWTMQIIGDRCFVTTVDKGSDAEAKGVKPGDEVVEAGGYQLDRTNLWKFLYLYNALRPQQHIHTTLRSPNGEQRELDLLAKRKDGKRVTDLTNYNEWMDMVRRSQRDDEIGRDRYASFADELLIWKMNEFDLTETQVDNAMEKVRKHKALILDLRGNGGGWVTTIQRLLANLVDHDVKIADEVSRKETKPLLAKSRNEKAFKGKLMILVDSRSASASEVLARTIQLEKRGTVIGDRTAGAVMESRRFTDQVGLDVVVFYGASITMSDLIMSDGKSLEKVGVTPDEVRLPSAEDFASGRDSVLSYAASLFGVKLDPVEAGKLFPIERPETRN
jgi:C-terminal processing protease CtpA/Prc